MNCLENYPGYGQIIYVVVNGENTSMQCLVLYDQGAGEPVVILENVQKEDDLKDVDVGKTIFADTGHGFMSKMMIIGFHLFHPYQAASDSLIYLDITS